MAKHGKKRLRLKREQARARSGSQYRRIGTGGEVVACHITPTWKEDGIASMFVLLRAPGGGHALAAFLVDIWCMGIKDAWGRLDITPTEYSQNVIGMIPPEVGIGPTDIETIQRIVAGGIRFAQQNGFRLPPRYERWTAMLGDIGNTDEADLSDFGVEDGKLRYVGNLEDLSRRLVGCSVDEFLAREDIDFVINPDDDSTLLDDSAVAVEEVAEVIRRRGLSAIRQWCFANNIPPHAQLGDAWDVMVEAMMQVPADDELDDDGLFDESVPLGNDAHSGAVVDAARANVDDLLALNDPATTPELQRAMAVVAQYMQQFDSPEELFDSLDLDNAFNELD